MLSWLRRLLGDSPPLATSQEVEDFVVTQGRYPPGLPRQVLKTLTHHQPTNECGSCLLAVAPEGSVELTLHWIKLKPYGELHSFSCGPQLLRIRLRSHQSHSHDKGYQHQTAAVETSHVADLEPEQLKQNLPLPLARQDDGWYLKHVVHDSDRYGSDVYRWTFLLRPEEGVLELELNHHRDSGQ